MKKLAYATALVTLGIALIYNYCFTYNYVQVNTVKGILRGFETTTQKGTSFFSFKGIPYAKSPIGELRFKSPQEETAWAGVRDALTHGNTCLQSNPFITITVGHEDCLFLNVYTPSLGNDKLPVMVWIHGGGFELGSGNDDLYGPDYLIDAGVILVTFNYRIGALGFLSTGDDGAPGNAGLKDQVAALRWVRRNIKRFGGDPDNVTIFGESAGGACVHYHLLSPMSAGLFERAIAQSGNSMNTWAHRENAPAITLRLAESLGAKDIEGDVTKALEFLKVTPSEDIVKVQNKLLSAEEIRNGILFMFVPTVETGVKFEEAFLSDKPLNILKSGNFNKVPYITGLTSHEGYFFTDLIKNEDHNKVHFEDPERYVPSDIDNKVLRYELAESILRFYFDNKSVGRENVTDPVDLYTDIGFLIGINRATQLQLKSSKNPIYYYIFSYNGGLNLMKSLGFVDRSQGATHGDELGYLFTQKLIFWRKSAVDSDDEYVLRTMIRLWTNFAKYGDPTPPGDPLSWKPMTFDEFNYLNISGRDTRSDVNPEAQRAKFWARAYEKYDKLLES